MLYTCMSTSICIYEVHTHACTFVYARVAYAYNIIANIGGKLLGGTK